MTCAGPDPEPCGCIFLDMKARHIVPADERGAVPRDACDITGRRAATRPRPSGPGRSRRVRGAAESAPEPAIEEARRQARPSTPSPTSSQPEGDGRRDRRLAEAQGSDGGHRGSMADDLPLDDLRQVPLDRGAEPSGPEGCENAGDSCPTEQGSRRYRTNRREEAGCPCSRSSRGVKRRWRRWHPRGSRIAPDRPSREPVERLYGERPRDDCLAAI